MAATALINFEHHRRGCEQPVTVHHHLSTLLLFNKALLQSRAWRTVVLIAQDDYSTRNRRSLERPQASAIQTLTQSVAMLSLPDELILVILEHTYPDSFLNRRIGSQKTARAAQKTFSIHITACRRLYLLSEQLLYRRPKVQSFKNIVAFIRTAEKDSRKASLVLALTLKFGNSFRAAFGVSLRLPLFPNCIELHVQPLLTDDRTVYFPLIETIRWARCCPRLRTLLIEEFSDASTENYDSDEATQLVLGVEVPETLQNLVLYWPLTDSSDISSMSALCSLWVERLLIDTGDQEMGLVEWTDKSKIWRRLRVLHLHGFKETYSSSFHFHLPDIFPGLQTLVCYPRSTTFSQTYHSLTKITAIYLDDEGEDFADVSPMQHITFALTSRRLPVLRVLNVCSQFYSVDFLSYGAETSGLMQVCLDMHVTLQFICLGGVDDLEDIAADLSSPQRFEDAIAAEA